jgi:hypothetical protein
MKKHLLSYLPAVFALACSSAPIDDSDYWSDDAQGEELGSLEQDITVQQVYGVQLGNAGKQLRCVAGASSDCMVPSTRTIEVDIDVNGIPLNNDRQLFASMLEGERVKLDGLDNGFNIQHFSQTGFPPAGESVCLFHPQAVFAAQSPSATDTRHYIGGYQYGGLTDQGTYTQWNTFQARGDFAAMKAHKGGPLSPDGSCINAGGNPCLLGMRKMVQAFLGACVGAGLTSNVSANGTGIDVDVVTTNTQDAITTGDSCRAKAYNPSGAGVTIQASSCAL